MAVINLDLTYAVEVTWKHISFHDFLLTMLPVLVFFVLGLSMTWLIYQAWQEQAYLEALTSQLRRERELVQQKRNFVSLSSHYLRTPLAIITNSIDLAASLGASGSSSNLKPLGQSLGLAVNALLDTAHQELPQAQTPARPKSINSSVRYLAFSVVGAFAAISLAVYLLVYLNKDDVKLSTLIISLAMVLLLAVIIFSARRVHNNRKTVKQYFKELIIRHRMLDKQRSNLVSSALAQIKSPLNELKVGASSISEPKLSSQIKEGISKFDYILQKFTIYDGLQMGTMGTARQEFELNYLIDRVIQRHTKEISAKKLKIDKKVNFNNITQDALLVEYVIDSIIDNAITYSPENQTIKISTKRKGDIGKISIEDRGPGIDKSKILFLFQPFSSAEDPKNYEHEGIGLSLYLGKLIMLYLGGNIDAESKIGRGTVIKLNFRLNK